MIHSSSITNYGMISDEMKVGTSIEVEKSPIKASLEEKGTQLTQEKRQEQNSSLNKKSVSQTIEELNKKLEDYNKRLEYSIHERTNRILVKVIDIQTEEVIKEIPDEKLMDMMADLCEASGILVDEKI